MDASEGCLGNVFTIVQGFLLRVTRVRFLICGSLHRVVLGRSGIEVHGTWLDFGLGYSVGLESRGALSVRCYGAEMCKQDLL